MATITPAAPTANGAAITFVAASASDTIATGNKRTALMVNNGSGADITVTIAAVETCNHGNLDNQTATITAGAQEAMTIDPWCVDTSTGHATVTYSAITSVTVAAVRI